MWHDGTRTDIGRGSPIALNELGEALVSRGNWPFFRARLWRNGTMTDLGTLGGKDTEATAISNRGQVVGSSTDSRGRQHGFVWRNGVMIRLPSPPGYRGARTRALGINDHNQIIGDNCLWDCGESRSIRHPSRFAVRWTLRGHKIETRRLADIRS
jgi:probable HAF family extracellular repeat protein